MFKSDAKDRIVGIVVQSNGQLQVKPCNKKQRLTRYALEASNTNGCREGDVVVLETLPSNDNSLQARVLRVLGQKTSPGILSLISICEKGLSDTFSAAALNETKTMAVPDLQGREDLRNVPLVTIDGADSRDFDDAVFSETTAGGGFHLIVAIADVSWYVRPGSPLDQDAYTRGNSTYFPDRVIPMLPEALSNDLCSLKPHEDRACLAFHLQIDKDGNLTDQKITRALMKTAARLTYKQVQEAKDGQTDATTKPLMNTVIAPLYDAYAALRKARDARGAMDLDMPESKVTIDANGKAVGVTQTGRIDSQRLIEEFMVLANVAAATVLQSKQAPCIFRNHATPPFPEKVEALRAQLAAAGLTLPAGDIKSASAFNDVMKKAAALPDGSKFIKAILTIQAKAVYGTQNIGHFGLALENYAHFTSPIRRYADLLVHRSLVDAFNMGAGGLDTQQKAQMEEMAKHISETEKLSDKAVRSAHERFAIAALSQQVGKEFTGRITGVTNAGLFIRLDNTNADGLLPMKSLPADYYDCDQNKNTLTGRTHGRIYSKGETIAVRLKEADALMGSILLEAANDNAAKALKKDRPNNFRPK